MSEASSGPDDPVEIYRARGLPEAHTLRILLEEEGIPVRIDNELLHGAAGELPLGWATAPRVIVDRSHEAAARAVVESFLRPASEPEEGEDSRLRCLACGTPMGEAVRCPACGWSYGQEAEPAPDAEPAPPRAPVTAARDEPGSREAGRADPSAPVPGPTIRAEWGEVAAVLAVGVVPSLASALVSLHSPSPPLPYWLSALYATTSSACISFVTLYLIYRSGEPWERFGITRLGFADVLLGGLLLLTARAIWLFQEKLTPGADGPPDDLFPVLQGPVDQALMVLMHGANALAEELVTRAYLITRLTDLLQSRGGAVVLAACAFASYHVYQGPMGAVYNLLFGLAYGGAYLLIGRIWPLVIGHALYNVYLELTS